MSFLRAAARLSPIASRTPIASSRYLSTTQPTRKTAAESLQDANKKAGDAAVKGIEKGRESAIRVSGYWSNVFVEELAIV